MQHGIYYFRDPPAFLATGSVVGKKEHAGPLGKYFDYHDDSDAFGQDTWEKSEGEMQRLALNFALSKAKILHTDVDALFAGDLMNQCVGSSYGLLDFDIPFFGLYGACSTSVESIGLAALGVGNGIFEMAAAVTSSHNCSAERQFRYPLEYGGQRSPTAQWTVTGAGAFLLGHADIGPYVTEFLPGRTLDAGVKDLTNMGAAMAPAVIDTLTRYFAESKCAPDQFDLILTGDLGEEGHRIVTELMAKNQTPLGQNYTDCGLLIYDRTRQDMHAGGSGCGCCASVLAGYLTEQFRAGKLRDILVIATGALMSPASVQQGCSIPAIAHLIRIRKEKGTA